MARSDTGLAPLGELCAAFGGVYSRNGEPQCTVEACHHANPYTSECSCPPGFTPSEAIKILDDRSCPSGNPPYGWQGTHVCHAGAGAAESDFAGFYQRQGATCLVGNPLAGGTCDCPAGSEQVELGCQIANPATGACSCPDGTISVAIRVVYGPSDSGCSASGAAGGHIYVCYAP